MNTIIQVWTELMRLEWEWEQIQWVVLFAVAVVVGIVIFLLRRKIWSAMRTAARGARRGFRLVFGRIPLIAIVILLLFAVWMLFRKVILAGSLDLLVVGGLVLALVVSSLVLALVWFYLAPNNMFFTFVDESTAKIVVRGGQVRKVLVQLKEHTLDQDWNIVLGQERHLFGGLRWIGIWPLDEMYIYQFRWTNVLHDGTVQPHPAEWLDYILLKQDVYYFTETAAEDADLLPLEVEVLLTLKVVNPYKALFAVQDWLEAVINRYRPAVRDRVAQDRYETLINQKGSMANELLASSADVRQQFLDEYGVEVIAVEIKDIEPPEEHRNATLQKWLAERDAERVRVGAEAEADRTTTTFDAVRGIKGLLLRWLESKYGEKL